MSMLNLYLCYLNPKSHESRRSLLLINITFRPHRSHFSWPSLPCWPDTSLSLSFLIRPTLKWDSESSCSCYCSSSLGWITKLQYPCPTCSLMSRNSISCWPCLAWIGYHESFTPIALYLLFLYRMRSAQPFLNTILLLYLSILSVSVTPANSMPRMSPSNRK